MLPKSATGADTLKFAKRTYLASLISDIDKLKKLPSGLNSLKSKVDKLHVDKLEPVPVDLIKLSDIVKKEVAKKQHIMNLLEKVNANDTSGLVYDAKIRDIEGKIPGITNLATNLLLKIRFQTLLI